MTPILSQLDTERIRRGWSISELARRVGTSQPAMSAILSGRRRPTHELLERIAGSLGLQITVKPAKGRK